jgi:hypothetical protein
MPRKNFLISSSFKEPYESDEALGMKNETLQALERSLGMLRTAKGLKPKAE